LATDRNLRHIVLGEIGRSYRYKGKGGGPSERPSDVQDRNAHAELLLAELAGIPQRNRAVGTYIEVIGRSPDEPFVPTALDASGLSILRLDKAIPEAQRPARALVLASSKKKGLASLRKKIEAFAGELPPPRAEGESRPRNANLVQSIGRIREPGLEQLWRHPTKPMPTADSPILWEVWLTPDAEDLFLRVAAEAGLEVHSDRLTFPDDVVRILTATPGSLAEAVFATGAARAIGPPGTPVDFVDTMEPEEQAEWVDDLAARSSFAGQGGTPAYAAILDTGISRAHPLIQPALEDADRHASYPGWSVEDLRGHGTKMAGLVLYGDLRLALESLGDIQIPHRLESAKVLPDAGENPHHLLGSVTRKGIDEIEKRAERRRFFGLASTTDADTPHSGAPTSWSTEIDQLAAGVSGDKPIPRLFAVSAGNHEPSGESLLNYLAVCDDEGQELQSPAQAWNAICVGAMTEKTGAGGETGGKTIAPSGDLSPSSRTASWGRTWPIKPDVVLEGGNYYDDGWGVPNTHGDLMAVTTSRSYPGRSFTHCADTSAATALALRDLAILGSEYPNLWPETIRALYVSSARWTDQMRSHLSTPKPPKGEYEKLFRRYGYGVPDLDRARRSADNAVSLIVQDRVTPYTRDAKMGNMKLFQLPWPVEALRGLGNSMVTLRVCLSTFIEPNPSEVARGRKLRYASHGLRFQLKPADEGNEEFARRIGREARIDELATTSADSTRWTYGTNRRDVGSIHIDTLEVKASDLARQNVLAVHAVGGWWKDRKKNGRHDHEARFALVVEIDAEENEAALYAEVQSAVASRSVIRT
jgi:hypothetical protein